MTEQELRDEFDGVLKFLDEHCGCDPDVGYFCENCNMFNSVKLFQETIEKQKKEIEDLRRRSYKYYGLLEQIKLDKKNLEETIKAKDATIAELESRLEQSVDISVVDELNETIKAKDAEIERINQNIEMVTDSLAKAIINGNNKDAEIESLKGAYSIVADANTEKLFELEKKSQAITEAREIIEKSIQLTEFQYREKPEYRAMELMTKHDKDSSEHLEKVKAWLEYNK